MRDWLLLTAAGLAVARAFDPFADGPYRTTQKTYHSWLNPGLDNLVDVWVPNTSDRIESPVVYMIGGFGGLLWGDAYKTVLARVASNGFTVVQPWINGDVTDNYEGVWIDGVVDWIRGNLRSKLSADGVSPGLIIDHDSMFLMSNSAGCHVTAEYLKHRCGLVKGQILLSPVDGEDPYGLIPVYAITPGEYLNFHIPTLILSSGLDGIPGIDGFGDLVPACAPADRANLRFYDAMPGNVWLVNATDFGHADYLDQIYCDTIEFTHFCAAAPRDAPRDDYRRFISGEAVTFMSYVLGTQSEDVLRFIEDTSLMPINATAFHKASTVYSHSDYSKGHCDWQADPYPHSDIVKSKMLLH